MIAVSREDAVCSARDAALRQSLDIDAKKHVARHMFQLHKWLLDATPPVTGWKAAAKKLSMVNAPDDAFAFESLVVSMINGTFWKRKLSGWVEVSAVAIALYSVAENGALVEMVECIADRCKFENDDLQKRMYAREMRSRCPDDPPLQLADVTRNDRCSEGKWTMNLEFLRSNNLEEALKDILLNIESCVESMEPPRTVVGKLHNLPKPPGYTTAEERKEEERLLRAKEIAEDSDF